MVRKITSLTCLLSFLLTIVTSVVLYIVPAGRVAYWADWRLWGMTKTAWTNLHVNLGVLFLIAILLHTYFNWNSILAYLKNQSKALRLFTPAFNISLFLSFLFILGTLAELPPFATINKFSEKIKDQAAQAYGEPPYGHAELSSLKTFTQRLGLNAQESLERLRAAGLTVVDSNQTLLDLAKTNKTAPQTIYRLIQVAEKTPPGSLPEKAPSGLGKKSLAEISTDHGLEINEVMEALSRRDIPARKEMSLKQIGEALGKDPMEIYQILRDQLEAERASQNNPR
ncbi:MAG: DUF4405 domain-containing protein [Deltaproteobacteria bacterium]|nr:DUF4405 domain-containing protein [Deltaproteobacteria bacterium]